MLYLTQWDIRSRNAIYYVICPSVFLMNSFEMKTKIVENPIYQAMISRISCCHKVDETNDDDEADDPSDENEGNNEEWCTIWVFARNDAISPLIAYIHNYFNGYVKAIALQRFKNRNFP